MRLFDYGKLAGAMREFNMDLLLASSQPNVGYLADLTWYPSIHPSYLSEDGRTYYASFVGLLPDGPDSAFFIGFSSESMYVEWKDPWIKDRTYAGADFHVEGGCDTAGGTVSPVAVLARTIKDKVAENATIGIEWEQMRIGTFEKLKELLPRATFVDCDSILWKLRMVKCEAEIQRLRSAAQGCSRAADKAYRSLREGMTELEWEKTVIEGIHEAGLRHEYTEIAFGPKGADLVDPTDNRLEPGHLVRLDIGGSYQGYLGDLSRSLAFGNVSEEARRAHAAILRINRALRAAIRPGVKCGDLYRICMSMFAEAGYTPLTRQAGHSLGRTVHEPPFLVDDSDMALESGMVINVEPTMRIKGIGSVNIEDTLVVRDGEPERLTTVPQELEHYSPRP
jgi:Xaa-Pro aminopeptidase